MLFVSLAQVCASFCCALNGIAPDWRSRNFGPTDRMPGCQTFVALALESAASYSRARERLAQFGTVKDMQESSFGSNRDDFPKSPSLAGSLRRL